VFSWLSGPFTPFWLAVCAFGGLVALIYLLFMWRAKAILSNFVAQIPAG